MILRKLASLLKLRVNIFTIHVYKIIFIVLFAAVLGALMLIPKILYILYDLKINCFCDIIHCKIVRDI